LLARYPNDPNTVRKLITKNLRGELTEPTKSVHRNNSNNNEGEDEDGESSLGYESRGFLDTVSSKINVCVHYVNITSV